MDRPPTGTYAFGPYLLDPTERTLRREGELVPLTPKAFDTLCLLVQNSGHVLEKDDMMRKIWPDTFVEEATLAQNVFTLRKVLGETPDDVKYIETVVRKGYRFVARVTAQAPEKRETASTSIAVSSIRSIAVLPFKLLTPDKTNEYFSVGIADALITRLSNIKDIVVRPTSAVLKYGGYEQDPLAAGRDLRVQLILDGIIQRLDDRIRLTVQLVKIEDGVPLWAEKFDENFSDIFTVQDAISKQVVEALTLRLTMAERELLTKHYTRNSEAYRTYLKGRYLWNKWTANGFKMSMMNFERAIEIEPGYAPAYAGLADSYNALAFYGHVRPHEAMPRVKAMAKKALELDDSLSEGHLPLAAALLFYDWDWEGAEKEFKRCIELNPGYAMAHQSYGLFLIAMARFNEALEKLRRAIEIDPLSPLIKTTMGFPYYFAGEYDQAVQHYQATLEEDPNFGLAYASLGDVYLQKGMYDEAISEYQKGAAVWGRSISILSSLGFAFAKSGNKSAALEKLAEIEALASQQYVSPLSVAIIHIALDNKDEAFDWLEKSYQEKANKLVFLGVQPTYNSIRSDPRFVDLMKRIGLKALGLTDSADSDYGGSNLLGSGQAVQIAT
jgi:TolB-like protein/Flp pilus assembly protein TadD